jgi:putative transcriptional regulator
MGPSQAIPIEVQAGQHGRCDAQWVEGTEEIGAEARRGHFCRLHGSPDVRCRLTDDYMPPGVGQQVCGDQTVVARAYHDRIGRAFLIPHTRRGYRRGMPSAARLRIALLAHLCKGSLTHFPYGKHTFHMDNRVRELRATHDLSQGQLGDALGVSRQTINAIENGRYLPSLPLAIAIARYFGSTVEQIFVA